MVSANKQSQGQIVGIWRRGTWNFYFQEAPRLVREVDK